MTSVVCKGKNLLQDIIELISAVQDCSRHGNKVMLIKRHRLVNCLSIRMSPKDSVAQVDANVPWTNTGKICEWYKARSYVSSASLLSLLLISFPFVATCSRTVSIAPPTYLGLTSKTLALVPRLRTTTSLCISYLNRLSQVKRLRFHCTEEEATNVHCTLRVRFHTHQEDTLCVQ